MSKVAIVTGAGSGVGRATALALAAEGWRVVLFGRRIEPLRETASLGPEGKLFPEECDIGNRDRVRELVAKAERELGTIGVLVNAAGTNAPRRALEVLSIEDYRMMLDANLNGAYYCIEAVLPGMRKRQSGTIVNIVSDAAKQASAKAGPAYVISKFGLLGLTQSVNAEERGNGVRACAILPGDIDTPLLDKRPAPPPAEVRARMLLPEDVARCAMLAINLPPRAIIEELLVRPR